MKYLTIALSLTVILVICGCSKKPALQKLEDPYSAVVTDSTAVDEIPADEIAYKLPFENNGNGRYHIDAALNGVTLKFLWDTGASMSTISSLELGNLQKAGVISQADVVGMQRAQMAGGDVLEVPILNIGEVTLTCADGQKLIIRDVEVMVFESQTAEPLFGANIMSRLPKHKLNFETGYIEMAEQ